MSKKYQIGSLEKLGLAAVGIYEGLLVTNFLVATVMAPIMFFMGFDADPTAPRSPMSWITGVSLILIFGAITPLSFILNWYMVFSKKREFPKWFIWIVPLPFLGLLVLSLMGHGLRPFIPFSFN